MEEGGAGTTKTAADGGPPPNIPVTGGLAPLPDTGAGYENAGGDDDEDLEDLDRHHSLPTPEEIKVDRPSTTNPFGKNFWVQFLIMIILLLALTIGLAVGLTQRNAKSGGTSSLNESKSNGSGTGGTGGGTSGGGGGSNLPPNTGTSSQKDRRSQIKEYIIAKGVSQAIDFEKGDSAQSLALDFLSYIDQMNLPVPQSNTPSITDQGYRLITRYVVSVVYYSTSGPTNWEWDLNFMNPTEDVCNWFTQSQLYGFEGVNCLNNDGVLTMEIQSLRFGTLSLWYACCVFVVVVAVASNDQKSNFDHMCSLSNSLSLSIALTHAHNVLQY